MTSNRFPAAIDVPLIVPNVPLRDAKVMISKVSPRSGTKLFSNMMFRVPSSAAELPKKKEKPRGTGLPSSTKGLAEQFCSMTLLRAGPLQRGQHLDHEGDHRPQYRAG